MELTSAAGSYAAASDTTGAIAETRMRAVRVAPMRLDADRSRLQPRSGPACVGRAAPPSGRSTCSIDTTFGRADVRCLAAGRSLGSVSRKIPGFASPPFDGFAEFADRTLRQPMWLPSSD